jgi:hypothetical protein
MDNVTELDPNAQWRKTTERRLAALERLQALRIEVTAKRKQELDDVLARHQREIDNLRATLEVGE